MHFNMKKSTGILLRFRPLRPHKKNMLIFLIRIRRPCAKFVNSRDSSGLEACTNIVRTRATEQYQWIFVRKPWQARDTQTRGARFAKATHFQNQERNGATGASDEVNNGASLLGCLEESSSLSPLVVTDDMRQIGRPRATTNGGYVFLGFDSY
jgi:hypothetical protein